MASNPQREPLSAVDRAWLGMDSPVNLMVINTVLLFDEPVDFDRLRNVCGQRLVGRFRRFRQRVVGVPGGRLYWEDDNYFDLRTHILRVALPPPGDTHTLQSLLSGLINEQLDRFKPLWRFYLVENLNGGCALICRIHHAVADGIALVKVLLSLTDESAMPARSEPINPKICAHPWGDLRQRAGDARARVRGMAARGMSQLLRSIDDPSYALSSLRSVGLLSAASAAIAAKLLLIPPDRPSTLKGDLGVFKRVIWTEPVSLAQVKAIGVQHGATVNDVLMAVVAGGLRRYLQGRGDPVDEGVVRTLVPVNLRPAEEPLRLGNHFSLVYLSLPVSVADPQERLLFVKERMTVLKQSPEPYVTYGVINGLGLLPGEWAQRAVEMFAGKATAVLTNVPGPRQVRYLAGSPIDRILFWVPQSGQLGIGISIISYAGRVTIGVMVDEKLAPDAQVIPLCFAAEMTALAEAVASPSMPEAGVSPLPLDLQ